MATLREIKKRVGSVNNIAQITNAMQMVAASKMKKAQDRTEQFKDYADKISRAAAELSRGVDPRKHRLLFEGNPEGKRLLILISTDKGLCGALNSNLFRAVIDWYPDLSVVEAITVGKKGQSFCRKQNAKLTADFSGKEPAEVIPALNSYIVDGFLDGKYSEVELIFNRFVNSFTQEPTRRTLLPLTKIELKEEDGAKTEEIYGDFLIEPSPEEVLDSLLPEYIENQIRDAAYSAEASEYSARMLAMKNATDNAEDLSDNLTLEYNKLRQKEITLSIADMVTARLAVQVS